MTDYGVLDGSIRQFAVFDWETDKYNYTGIDSCYLIVDIDGKVVAEVVDYIGNGCVYAFFPIGQLCVKCFSIHDGKTTVNELLAYWGFKKVDQKWKLMR